MALLYFKYRTDFDNTIVASQATPFSLGPNEAEIQLDFEIPQSQAIYLYKEDTGAIVENTEYWIIQYERFIDIDSSDAVTEYIYSGYTGTTAPATYLESTDFDLYSGTTVPATYISFPYFEAYTASTTGNTGISSATFALYTGTTAPATFQSKASIVVLTGTTLPLTYQSKSSIVTLTGTTLPNQYAAKSAFLLYTGTTAHLTFQSKSSIVTLTGTTLPNQYAAKSAFLLFTGTTAPLTYQSKSSIVTLTGTTLPNQYAAKSAFLLFTGTTAPLTYQSKSSIVTLTGTTLPNQYAAKSAFLLFTGTTAPLTYQSKSSIVTLTGTTLPLTYLAKSVFFTYTGGTTNVTSASNGIRKNGNNVRLGGSLTGSTNIGLGTFNLIFTGTTGTLRYGSDLSAQYNVRTIIDKGYYTGNTLYTRSQLLIYSSASTNVNVTTPVSIPFNVSPTRSDVAIYTTTGGTTIRILVAGTYDISYLVSLTSSSATAKSIAANIYRNATIITQTYTSGFFDGTGTGISLSLPSTQITFAANDVIQLRAYRLITATGNATLVPNSTFLSIIKKN